VGTVKRVGGGVRIVEEDGVGTVGTVEGSVGIVEGVGDGVGSVEGIVGTVKTLLEQLKGLVEQKKDPDLWQVGPLRVFI